MSIFTNWGGRIENEDWRIFYLKQHQHQMFIVLNSARKEKLTGLSSGKTSLKPSNFCLWRNRCRRRLGNLQDHSREEMKNAD